MVWELIAPKLTDVNFERRKGSPFSDQTDALTIPSKFKMPTWKIYTGKEDPMSHMNNFEIQTDLQGVRDDVCCRIISATLDDSAQEWFFKLEHGTINSWDAFVRLFYSQFFTARILLAELNDLVDIKQVPNEPLKDYVQHFMQEVPRSKTVSNDGKLLAIMAGIQVKGLLWTDLRRNFFYSTREFLDRADKFIKLERAIQKADQANQARISTAPAKNTDATNHKQTINGNGNKKNQNGGNEIKILVVAIKMTINGQTPMIGYENTFLVLPPTLCS
ncbi:uncharacterized protein LOC133825519 [Humulus lupulus]|uniref:uncharacterized protein LOC133825519 n=1 Tax=Humulus lupulus TaxID=3486 RepID=UPI002B410242|nr:uncharacterized protein LOC133825519 [Humulus lupulus]